MDQEHLHQTLESLHRELADTTDLDPKSRELLETVLRDIQRAMNRDADHDPAHGMVDRLRDAVTAFEGTHPFLATLIGRVADGLANLGI